MFVNIRGVKRENFSGVWRAGRFWPSSEALRVEVVKDEPPKIVEDILEHGRKVGTREVPDMTKIGKTTLEELKKDGRVTVLQDGETDDVANAAALETARKTNAELTSRVAALEAENAKLKEAHEGHRSRVTEDDADKSSKHSGGKRT